MKSSTNIVNIDESTYEQIFYVDIKSEGLRDILRVVLKDLRGISLREAELTVRTPYIISNER